MDPITVTELARVVGGDLFHADPVAVVGPDVVIDSRQVTPGAVFVAFAGEHVDGHDYVAAANRSGASVSVVGHAVDDGGPQIVCGDPAAALAALGTAVVGRARAQGLVTVALTGSSGKTSTKDLIAQILEAVGPTVAPQGSFNNEIGVPLTACEVTSATRFLVSEMGARGQGHISWLCSIVPPDIAAVVNVGTAHLGEFGSVADIAVAKSEIIAALPPSGWAILNAADELVAGMSALAQGRIGWFSADGPPSQPGNLRVWASQISADERARHSFTLHVERDGETRTAPVSLQVIGRHSVANALAASTVAVAAGIDVSTIAAALTHAVTRSRWRMELDERSDGVAVLNDAYNANPESMKAGIRALEDLSRARRRAFPGARMIAVLGEMRELGTEAAAAHVDVGRAAAAAGVDWLVCLGPNAADLSSGAAAAAVPIPRVDVLSDKSAVAGLLGPELHPGDAILIKASRGAELDTVAADLLKEA